MRFCHNEAMQLARSRTTKGVSCSLRHAATANPDGPAPTMTGPLTQTQRRVKAPFWSEKLNIFFFSLEG